MMKEKFRDDLMRILRIYYTKDAEPNGYTIEELDAAENRLGVEIPEILRIVYQVIAKDNSLALDFYPPERLMVVHEPRKYNGKLVGTYTGFIFAEDGERQYAYFPDRRRDSDYAVYERLEYRDGNGAFWGRSCPRNDQYPAYSDFLEFFAQRALYAMKSLITVSGKDYKKICLDKFHMQEFESYLPFIFRGTEEMHIFYSQNPPMLAIFDERESPKLVIASDDADGLAEIAGKQKIRWLQRDGKKIVDPKNFCTDTIPEDFEERLTMMYQILFGNISKHMDTEQWNLPEELKTFYRFFGNKKAILDSQYKICPIHELSADDGYFSFAEEEQGAYAYLMKAETGEIFFKNEENLCKLNMTLADFILYLLAVQGTGICSVQGMIENNDENKRFFAEIVLGDERVYINRKRKIIGFQYSEESILIMARTESAFWKLEEQCGILISEL